MTTERDFRCHSCKSPSVIYRSFIEGFFSQPVTVTFGIAFAIIRLTYGLVEALSTLCLLEKYVAIILTNKGFLELVLFWTPLLVFRCCKMVNRASENPCFEIYVYAFTVAEFMLLVSEIVLSLGYYNGKKTTCLSIDPDWNVHFANFAISQTVIDGITWIGTIFAVCFRLFEREEPDMVEYRD